MPAESTARTVSGIVRPVRPPCGLNAVVTVWPGFRRQEPNIREHAPIDLRPEARDLAGGVAAGVTQWSQASPEGNHRVRNPNHELPRASHAVPAPSTTVKYGAVCSPRFAAIDESIRKRLAREFSPSRSIPCRCRRTARSRGSARPGGPQSPSDRPPRFASRWRPAPKRRPCPTPSLRCRGSRVVDRRRRGSKQHRDGGDAGTTSCRLAGHNPRSSFHPIGRNAADRDPPQPLAAGQMQMERRRADDVTDQRPGIHINNGEFLIRFHFQPRAPPLLPSISGPTFENHVSRVTGSRSVR